MTESKQRSALVAALNPELHAVPIENTAGVGTPDINYRDGWIEVKYLPEWPKQRKTVPKPRHRITPEQITFARQRCLMGGRSFIAWKIENEWFFFWGLSASNYIGVASREQLVNVCGLHVSSLRKERSAVIEYLTRDVKLYR